MSSYDAILLVSFGGPEGPEDVMPFLENVLRGRNVPEARKLQVAEQYKLFGGLSPINAQNRVLRDQLKDLLPKRGIDLPIYWGNRNWKPFLTDTVAEMKAEGVKRALAFVTSAFGSYSGCRQYLENIEEARAKAGEGAPKIDKIRSFHNHPLLIEAVTDQVLEAMKGLSPAANEEVHIAFTAHSLPVAMAATSNYLAQLKDSARLVAEAAQISNYELVFQSRSGPPTQPWLEPDILSHLENLGRRGVRNVVVCPLGFLSDHLEVMFDLDRQAKEHAEKLSIHMVRSKTPGTHPKFREMVAELLEERMGRRPKRSLGTLGPGPDVCPPGCCEINVSKIASRNPSN